MSDLANLYIKVDSSGVVTASKDLDTLAGKSKTVETATGSMNSAFQSLKANWVAASVAIAAAWMAISKAIDYATIGAKALQAEESFRMVAKASGESANQILADMQRVSKGTIDDSDLMQKAVKGMVLGLSGNEMVNVLEASRLAARLTGEDVSTAYEKIIDAIATNMPRALRQYGLITKEQLTVVNQAIAAGVPNINLYGLAMANSAEQAKKLTIEERNVIEQIQKGHAEWQEATERVGKFVDKIIILWGKVGDLNKELNAHPPSLISWFGSLGAKTDAGLAPVAQTYVVPPIVKTPAQILDEMKAETRLIEQRKSTLEAMKVLDTNYFTQRNALITNTEEVAIINGQNEYTTRKATIDAMRALDADYRSKTLAEIQAEDDARTQTDKDKLSSAIFKHDKIVALDADMATHINERNLAEIKLDAEKNLAIYTSTGAAYMAINQYSQESTNFQIAEIDRLAKAQIIKATPGQTGNLVDIARQNEAIDREAADAKVKVYAAADNAMATADLEMWNTINSHCREAMKLQVTLWEAQAAEYIRLGHEKGLVEDWLQTKKLQYDQDWLRVEIDFYSQLKGYEDTYRTLKFQWIDNEEQRLAGLYKDDLAAFKWAQQEKLKLNTELSKSNTAAATTKNATPTGAPAATGQKFQMTWASYIGPLTDAVVQLLNKNQKDIDYAAKAPEREAAAKAAADAAKATADAAAQVAQAAADVVAAAEAKVQETLKQGIGLSIQIMQLSGDTAGALAVTRAQELAATDESLRPLQQRVYNLQDEATATELANKKQALNIQIMQLTGDATGALAAQRVIELATLDGSLRPLQERIYALQDEAAAQVEATQVAQDLAAAQDAAVEAQKNLLTTLVSQGQAIKDFIDSLGATGVSLSLGASRNAYMADLAGARAGDAASYGRITQSAGAYISTAEKSAGSSTDLARIVAGIKGELSGLAPVVGLDANIELLKLISQATKDTATYTSNLDRLGIKAIFDLTQVLTLVDNSAGLPEYLKKMIVAQAGDYKLWLQAQFDSTVSEPIKRILIDGAGIYAAIVKATLGTVDSASYKLAITALGNYQTTVNAAMGLADTASQKLALTAAGSYLSTVNASLGIVDESSRKLALTATGGYLTTVTAAMGIADTESRKLALTAVGTFLTTVNAVVGTVDVTARALGLNATNTLNATINATMGTSDPDAMKLGLAASNTLSALVNAALGTTDPEARALGLNVVNTLAATVTASLGFADPEARKLAIETANTLATTVTSAYQGTLTGGGMWGSGRDVALQMATTQSNALQTLVSATLTGNVANQLSGLLTGIAASDLVTLSGTVTWENSLLDLIRNATEQTAKNTGQYTSLRVTGGSGMAWDIMNSDGTIASTRNFNNSNSTGTATWLAVNESFKPQRFAEGGIASGSDSGYAATLHGTELVVSPRASYPATVRRSGNDNVILIEELRALRAEMKAGNYQIAKNTGKAAKILDNTLTKWDDLGTPAVAV